jgi:hypothetical protein
MSGALALLASARHGAINSAWTLHLEDISISTPGVRTVSFTLQTDGTATCVGAGSAPDWYVPIVAGIGSGWSARVSLADQVQTSTGGSALATWHAIGSARTFSFSNASSAEEGYGTATVEFSPDAGFSVAASCVMTWNVGYRA